MPRNTGKASEAIFEERWLAKDKSAYLERRVDLAAVRGMNPELKGVKFPGQPSDYLLTHEGVTAYCEVKSSNNRTSFPFSQFEKDQWKAMKQVTAAGGIYWVFIHNLVTDKWYRVPSGMILAVEAAGHKSIPWDALDDNRWLLT